MVAIALQIPVGAPARPVAATWHTGLVLLVLAAGSAASTIQHGLPNAHIPGLNVRLSSYVTVLVEEWLLVLMIWLGMRERGGTIGSLVSGHWRTIGAVCRDLGLALAFTVVIVPLDGLLMYLIGGNNAVLSDVVPHNGFELALWLILSATAGFCEELTFRGYLMQQFSAWTGSGVVGVVVQGVIFGLAHGYYGRGMVPVMLHGCLLGGLARWRRSLRPGMLAHGLQDTIGGIAGFLTS